MDLHRQILQGDVLEKAKEIPNESIDLIVTSPIYWNVRNYKVEGQWGIEPDFHEYLFKLKLFMVEMKRILKPTGTCWINLGDSYGVHTKDTEARGYEKSRILIPYRFAIQCVDDGWICRNDIIWAKPNAMPTSIPDRFQNKWESLFFFAKNKKTLLWQNKLTREWRSTKPEINFTPETENIDWRIEDCIYCAGTGKLQYDEELEEFLPIEKCEECEGVGKKKIKLWRGFDYYFDLDDIRETPLTKPQESFNLRIREAKKGRGFAKLGDDPRAWHCSSLEELMYDEKGVKKQDLTLGADGTPKKTYLQFNKRWKYKHLLDQSRTHQRILDNIAAARKILGKDHDSALNNVKGKNPSDVWNIVAKGFKGAHFATFPLDLPMRIIMCSCPKDGIVLDPFFGAGTVAIAAELLGRKWCGIELKQEYIDLARDRIQPYLFHSLSEFM